MQETAGYLKHQHRR